MEPVLASRVVALEGEEPAEAAALGVEAAEVAVAQRVELAPKYSSDIPEHC